MTARLARLFALILASSVVLSGCGSAHSATPFDYNASAPLHFVDRGRVNHDYPISVRDVSFALPDGTPIDGYLVVPPGSGPFPGVVYLHGSGGDRKELLFLAIWLAGRGAETLTITAPTFSYKAVATPRQKLVAERVATIAHVVAARRAADVLLSRPEIDAQRIGLVGWSAGARTGAIVSGVDRRFSAFDLLSAGSTPVSDYSAKAPEELRPAIERELGAVDPLRWVRDAAAGSILLQDGRRDEVVPRSALDALAAAAGKAAELRWYDQQHLPGPRAVRDGLDWIATKLRLSGPAVAGAATGP